MTSQERLADLYSSAITELSLVSHYEEEKQTHALRAQAYATLYLAEMVESKLATIEDGADFHWSQIEPVADSLCQRYRST